MRALALPRPRADNALLAAARRRRPLRYIVQGSLWAVVYGVAAGLLLYGAVLIRAGGWL